MTVRVGKRYSFTAAHRLDSPDLSPEQNRQIYGKCNNPFGHGHNYELELTVRGKVDAVTGRAIDLARLDQITEKQVLSHFRHRNLNEEIEAFRFVVPTTENLALEVERRLRSVWRESFEPDSPVLEKVRILETERNICEIVCER